MRMPAALDPARTVTGLLARYHCPNLNTLDRHLYGLTNRLYILWLAGRSPKQRAALRADIDLLLDRRWFLMVVGELD